MIKVSFLDVGQGDSIVITTPNPEVAYLVDIKHGRTVNDYLEENDINCLAAIFITHSDEDHISGLNYLLNNWGSDESFTPKTIKGFYINPDRYYVIKTQSDAEGNGQTVGEQLGKKKYVALLNSIYERMPSYGCRMEILTDKKGPFYCHLEHPTQIIDGKKVAREIPCDIISQVRDVLPPKHISNFVNKGVESCPCAGTITIEIDHPQGAIDVLPTIDAHKLVLNEIPFAKCIVD